MSSRTTRAEDDGPWAWSRRPVPRPDLRVSTAERTQVADALSEHYAAGRLDAAELNERLDRAVTAKTRADLSGLLDDLPSPSGEPPVPGLRPRRPFLLAVVLIAVVIALGASAWSTLHVPWLLIALVVIAVLWRRRHRAGRHLEDHPARRTF